MKIINNKTGFLMLCLFFAACSSKETQNQHSGNIYYHSAFDESNRMGLMDGDATLLTCMLEYRPAPKGANDGDGGRNLHITFKKPEMLKNGQTYKLPHPEIDAVVAEWGSPNAFNLNRNLSGSLTVVAYKPFVSAEINVQLDLRTGIDASQTFSLQHNEFLCNKHYKRYQGRAIEQESFDSSFVASELSAKDLDGNWTRTEEVFFDKATGNWQEIFFFPAPLVWNIKAGNFVSPKNTELKIENRRLSFKDEQGTDQLFAINHFSKDSLVVNNLKVIGKTRTIFVKRLN